MDSLYDFCKWRGAANLKAYIDAYLSVDSLRDLERADRLCDVHADGLLAVGVLACADDAVEVLDMEERRRRDLYSIDIRTCCKLLECSVSAKHELRIDGWMS